MQPKLPGQQSMLFTSRLDQILNDQHPLYELTETIGRSGFDKAFGSARLSAI